MRRLVIFLLLLACQWPLSAVAGEDVIAVVVPQKFSGKTPSPQEVALIFKRKKLAWADGSRVQPANLAADHAWRRQFSQHVLKSLPESQAQYWNGMYYHGIYPPYVAASPEAMLRFVAETEGAIGYVGACALDSRVKPVLWLLASGVLTDAEPALDCPGQH